MGAAVVLGQLASSSAFAGVDSAAHMAEEVCGFLLYTIQSTTTHVFCRSETPHARCLA